MPDLMGLVHVICPAIVIPASPLEHLRNRGLAEGTAWRGPGTEREKVAPLKWRF